ncbi:amino acid adenylation domain-containing protein [Streptomyces sp. DH37]|uniref:amino acid adenylation domain-containing protein n=1 Tax=Streptomyces sp. DH37 TaxID=3040122 RepID=UPI002441E033|nr:amino acid adenylation domain-containing protein [Streptomyces sp. DH37]MDG9702877.1 amino acid adenylation domain-containing protein [Streptomyces sp. DH37]
MSAAARRHGDRPAIIDGDRVVSYAELDIWSSRIANLLCEQGVIPGDRVALFLDKSAAAVAGIYGILKTGASYVPLDVRAPLSRLCGVAADCEIAALLSTADRHRTWRDLVTAHSGVRAIVALDGESPTDTLGAVRCLDALDLAARPDTPPPVFANSDALSYILYTSGSTGRPKGVMHTHRSALAFVDWAVRAFEITERDRLSSHAPLHFDLSVFDLYAAVRTAAAVVLIAPWATAFPVEVARIIATAEITVWYSVPTALHQIVRNGNIDQGAFPRLRTVLFAGEVFPTPRLRQVMNLMPNTRFANLYGPTETNVCTWYAVPELPQDKTEPIPIGRPIDGVTADVIGPDGHPVGCGEPGELLVSGPTVMRGYWGDRDRTERSLIHAVHHAAELAYRTGDIVRTTPEGDFEFLGRRDQQVKSRGYRIELGEIEAALCTAESVVECAVLAVPDEEITNRLVAFVVAVGPRDPAALRQHCSDQLPQYMIPDFEFIDRLPRGSTGKIDRQMLADELSSRTDAPAAPVTPTSQSPSPS